MPTDNDRLAVLLDLAQKKAASAQRGSLVFAKFDKGWQVGVFEATGGNINVFPRQQSPFQPNLADAIEDYVLARS